MEKKKNRSSLVIAAAVLCCVLAGCGQDARENGSPSEPDAYERGYDLPVDPVEQEEASRDCGEMMKAICAIYEEADKGTAVNAVISQETAETMQQAVGEKGVPAVLSGFEGNMLNYEKIDQFLKDASIPSIRKQTGQTVWSRYADRAVMQGSTSGATQTKDGSVTNTVPPSLPSLRR